MPKVMELVFMGLHALKGEAVKRGDGNHYATVNKILREIATLPIGYHSIDATKENMEHAEAGLVSARASAVQAHKQAAQLDAQLTGGGAANVQRAEVIEHERRVAEDDDHKAAVEQSRELAKNEPTPAEQIDAWSRANMDALLQGDPGDEDNVNGQDDVDPPTPIESKRRSKT